MGPEAAEPANNSAFSPCCQVRLPLFRIFGQIFGSGHATLFKYLKKWASSPRCHNWIFRFEDTGKVWFLGSNNPANPNQNPKYAVSIVAQLGTTKTGSIDEKIWGEIHVVLFLTYILTVWPNFLPCGLISDTEANFSVPVSGILAFLRTLSSPNFRHKNIPTTTLPNKGIWLRKCGRVSMGPGNSAHSMSHYCRQKLLAFQGKRRLY